MRPTAGSVRGCWCFLLLLCVASQNRVVAELRVDFSRTTAAIRPLHGINKGPLAPGGLIDVTEPLRAIAPPSARLHDCHWPNPDVVDIHAVFPDFNADPSLPSSYTFAPTDEYLAATRATGADIVYRLGESIEHTTTKRFVHPPRDFAKWAAICLGIIRHYNDGWANGFRYGIRYWEIWNEPENRPVMWTGSDEDYFRLYATTARVIRKAYPELKIGGPAVGYTGELKNGAFKAGAFVTNFLAHCKRETLPLDFFSWHCYTAEPAELAARARGIRRVLDEYGFSGAESHLNEWNYLPGNTWKPLSRSSAPETRQRFYEQMAGAAGAAFLIAALTELQSAPVDVCNLFHGELGGFGLFNEHGVPQKNYHALRAFRELLETPRGLEMRGGVPGLTSIAGINAKQSEAAILLSNFAASQSQFAVVVTNLHWTGTTVVETRRVNGTESFDRVVSEKHKGNSFTVMVELTRPAVALIRLKSEAEARIGGQ